MGNEQTIPQQNLDQNNTNDSNSPLYKMTIIIRGTRKTGKTTLVTRIKGFPFDEEYQSTSTIEITEIPWTSPDNENVIVNAWDTVEHIKSKIDVIPNQMDATSVDQIKKADGVVIMVDQFSDESIELAKQIIIEATDELPIAIFSNFMDIETATPVIPTALTQYMGRFFYIPGSLKTNQGLAELAKWLSLPLLLAKSKLAYQAYEHSIEEYQLNYKESIQMAAEFLNSRTAYEYLESAKRKSAQTSNKNDEYSTLADGNASSSSHSTTTSSQPSEKNPLYKKPYQRRPLRRVQTTKEKTNQTPQPSSQPQTIARNVVQKQNDDDDDFWNDDDEPAKPQTRVVRKKITKKAVVNDDDDEVVRPNPHVVRPKQQQKVIPKVVNPTATSKSQPSQSPPTEPKKKKIIRKRSTGSSNQSQQATVNSSPPAQEQQQQQQQYALKRKRKEPRRLSRNIQSEEPANEPAVDGYESF